MKVVLPEGARNAQGDSPCETGRAQERCTAPGGIRAALRLLPAEASGDRAPWRRLHLVLHRRPLRQAGLFHRRGPSRRSREEGGLHRRARLGLRRRWVRGVLGCVRPQRGRSARRGSPRPGQVLPPPRSRPESGLRPARPGERSAGPGCPGPGAGVAVEAARLGGELKKDAPSGREARLGNVTGALAALQLLPLVPRVLHLQMTGVGLGGVRGVRTWRPENAGICFAKDLQGGEVRLCPRPCKELSFFPLKCSFKETKKQKLKFH